MAPTVNVSTASIADLISQRDELVEALREVLPAVDAYLMSGDAMSRRIKAQAWKSEVQRARAALANVEGR